MAVALQYQPSVADLKPFSLVTFQFFLISQSDYFGFDFTTRIKKNAPSFFLSGKALLGENRQRFLERLKERLERRQKRQEDGLDPDEEDEETLRLLEEEQAASTGNILRDLQNRFDEEKDALLRRLQVESACIVFLIN